MKVHNWDLAIWKTRECFKIVSKFSQHTYSYSDIIIDVLILSFTADGFQCIFAFCIFTIHSSQCLVSRQKWNKTLKILMKSMNNGNSKLGIYLGKLFKNLYLTYRIRLEERIDCQENSIKLVFWQFHQLQDFLLPLSVAF